MKKSSSRNSTTSDHGDAASPPYLTPPHSLDAQVDNSKALVIADKRPKYSLPVSQPDRRKASETVSPAGVSSRPASEHSPPSATKLGSSRGDNNDRGMSNVAAEGRREGMLTKAGLGFRLSEAALCLVSFSVMAADKTQGWSGDSYDRYREYRYCFSVNIAAFAYAVFQAFGLVFQLATRKHVINHHLRYHFDFFMDQASSLYFSQQPPNDFYKVLAYLLISASSCAATRVDDWQSNWGKDEFTEMASASITVAFLAFAAFAVSSLISGYSLCTRSFISTSH